MESTLPKARPARPFVLGLSAAVLTAQAVVLAVMFVFTLFAPSDVPVTVNGVRSTFGEERLTLLGMLAVWIAFAGYVGPGLWRGRKKIRDFVAGVFVSIAVVDLAKTGVTYYGTSGFWVALAFVGANNLLGCAIVGWYLYRRPNVRAFFERGTKSPASSSANA